MVESQRRIAKRRGAVVEGRDIGTVVFPDADKKFYLDANLNERIKRRFKELNQMGQRVCLEEVKQDISIRDETDRTRSIAPLKKAKDAIYIDTTDMTIEEVVNKILAEIKK
jgi:cytidylate kinase